jgi:penicillin-binding protein 1B
MRRARCAAAATRCTALRMRREDRASYHERMPPRKPAKPRKRSGNLWYGLLAALIVGGSIGSVLLFSYLMKLDAEIRTRFAGVRWALPAQVFSAPMELYVGQRLSADTFGHELQRLGYRKVDKPAGQGTFIVDGSSAVRVMTRDFDFWDGHQDALNVTVDFSGGAVAALDDGSGTSRVLMRLDPMMRGSIYPQQHGEDRVLVKLDEVPQLLKSGLIAVEDRSFYEHHGVSLRGIARAATVNLMAGEARQGASTITQQLVRNFFLTLDRTWTRKINEMFMSVLLETHYGKDEILEAYINEVHLGQDGDRAIHGFALASRFYFNKPLDELRSHEIALLVGLVKGSSFYNPRRNPERALKRRNLVLTVFRDERLIDEAEYQAAIRRPLSLAGEGQGGAERYPAFVDLVKRQLRALYDEADLTDEGLRIFTTLDPRVQEVLERDIAKGVADIETARKMPANTLESAGVVTSADGGEVLGVVGGRRIRYAGFNRALDSRRSIGSLAKPFVYLTALRQPERFNLATTLADEPIELRLPTGKIWAPKNYDRKLHGPQPLFMALAHSMNLPTVRLGLEVGAKEVLQTMKDAGYTGDFAALPSVFLGAVDVAPIEIAQMYGTLAANGFQTPLSAIREVLTKEGQPLNRYSLQVKQTLPEAPVYLIDWALMRVMRLGTGASAYQVIPPSVNVAGKSGTTDDLRDSWFAGFGADRVTVIWVGRDDYQPTGLTGSTGALKIWSRVMRDIDVASLEPVPPGEVVEELTDLSTGLKADEGCPAAVLIPYVRGYAPQEFAPCANAAKSEPLQWLREIFE